MGQTNTGSKQAETDALVSAVAPNAPTTASALAREFIEKAAPTTAKRMRLAGDVLNATASQDSFADANAASKYSPDRVSKAPASQFLSLGANPTRLNVG